jgi:hypothetical protein
MDVLGIATGVLYAIEQLRSRRLPDDRELEAQLVDGADLLGRIESVSQAQIQKFGAKDQFMLRLVEEVENRTSSTPTVLAEKASLAASELRAGHPSNVTVWLFEQISEAAARMTTRSVDAISTSLQ